MLRVLSDYAFGHSYALALWHWGDLVVRGTCLDAYMLKWSCDYMFLRVYMFSFPHALTCLAIHMFICFDDCMFTCFDAHIFICLDTHRLICLDAYIFRHVHMLGCSHV